MEPATIRMWAENLTAPGILVILGLACWRLCSWIGKQFITPLGGVDGKLAKFFDATRHSIEEMPKAVRELEESFLRIGNKNQGLLEEIATTHRDPDASGFGTNTTNAMLKDLMRIKSEMADVLEAMAVAQMPEDDLEDVKKSIATIQRIVEKHI